MCANIRLQPSFIITYKHIEFYHDLYGSDLNDPQLLLYYLHIYCIQYTLSRNIPNFMVPDKCSHWLFTTVEKTIVW